jgi:NTF2-related export protein 1/2
VAETHVKKYYHALESVRNTISSFYSPETAMPDGKILPAILYNGNILPNAMAMQQMFETRMPPILYEIQSLDCQVINPNYAPSGKPAPGAAAGKNMTILILVSGYVKMGPPKEAVTKGFSETFVMAPNTEAAAIKKRGGHVKEWLIQTQSFRLVV